MERENQNCLKQAALGLKARRGATSEIQKGLTLWGVRGGPGGGGHMLSHACAGVMHSVHSYWRRGDSRIT